MPRRRRIIRNVVLGLIVVLAVIQLVPYGRDHKNPTPTRSLKFDSAKTKELFTGACADCHSYATTWPWYSNVAPVSWLVENDVKGGREEFNTSRWDTAQPGLDEIREAISGGEMPPLQYKPLHSGGRLSKAEKQALLDGLQRSYQADPPAATRG